MSIDRTFHVLAACVGSLILVGCDGDQERFPEPLEPEEQVDSSDSSPTTASPSQEGPGGAGSSEVVSSEGLTLTDTPWNLESYTSEDGTTRQVVDDTAYQFEAYGDSSEMLGFYDCVRAVDGAYEISDGFIVLQFGVREEVSCESEDPDYASQTRTLYEIFSGQGRDGTSSMPLMYSVEDDSLVLTIADGRKLRFSPVDRILTMLPER